MRQVSIEDQVVSQTFGVLVLSYVLVTIWWVLVGGGLGEPEDEDEEKDSSAGASEVVEKEYVMEVVVEEEKSQWWGPHEKRGLEQWKMTEAWRWGLVVKAWE